MSVTKFQIKRGSERFGSDGTYENTWVAEGEDNELSVQTHALNSLPPFVSTSLGVVFIQSFELQHEGHKLYYVTAKYGISETNNLNQEDFGTKWTVSGTTTGGTLKIYACRELIARYPSTLPDTKLIGVKPDGSLEGYEVIVPCLKIDISINTPMSILTAAYTRLMGDLTGTVNTNAWCTYDAGTLLYLGGDFKASSDRSVEVTHHVAYQKNLVDIMFAGFQVSKRGWDVWWPYYRNDVQGNQYGLTSDGVYIQRVYDYYDFTSYLGFG